MKQSQIIKTILIIIIILAFFIRLYNIDNIPAGIYPDEAVNGTDALNANETRSYKLFYENNYGREGLFMNLIALSISFFGPTIFALKIWSIIFGTLTVLGTFLLTRELFKNRYAALIAACLTAFSFWAINFSRISFRAIMLPLILTLSFYYFWKGIRMRKYWYFIVSGLIFGIGFHTYIAWRLAPAIIIVATISLMMCRNGFLKSYWKLALTFIFCVLLAMSPLIYDFINNPEHFSSRTGAISILSPEINHGHLFKTLGKTFSLSMIKYITWGDQNWRHNFPPYPILNLLLTPLFLVSFFYFIFKALSFIKAFFNKNKILMEDSLSYVFVLIWLFIMLAPEFLTAEGLPHALRAIGTLPAVFIMISVIIVKIFNYFLTIKPQFKNSIIATTILIIIFVSFSEIIKYHFVWAKKPQQYSSFNANFKNMATYIKKLPADMPKYVVPNGGGKIMEDGLPVSAQVIKYLTYKQVDNLFFTHEKKSLEVPCVIILMNYDQSYINEIIRVYPNAQVKKIDYSPNMSSDFTIIEIW